MDNILTISFLYFLKGLYIDNVTFFSYETIFALAYINENWHVTLFLHCPFDICQNIFFIFSL